MPTIKKQRKHKVKEKNVKVFSTFYNNKWTKLRNAYLLDHPLCEMCLKNGITKAAKEVHHIRPISTGKDELEMLYLTLDYNNLMSLCIECHHKVHQDMKKKH